MRAGAGPCKVSASPLDAPSPPPSPSPSTTPPPSAPDAPPPPPSPSPLLAPLPVPLPCISFAWNEDNPHVSMNLVGEVGLVGLPKHKLVMSFTISALKATSLREGYWSDMLVDYFGAEYASVRTQPGIVRVNANKTKVTSFRAPCTISGTVDDLEVVVHGTEPFTMRVHRMGTVSPLSVCRAEGWRNTGHVLRDCGEGWQVLVQGVLPRAAREALSPPSPFSMARANGSRQQLMSGPY